jgi:hypothetical protein
MGERDMNCRKSCKSCKYWDLEYNPMLEVFGDYGGCQAIPNIDIGSASTGAAFIPADFDGMPLMTHATFSCVLFEEGESDG